MVGRVSRNIDILFCFVCCTCVLDKWKDLVVENTIYFSVYYTGSRTVIHPKARIIAEDGPIYIGENNIVEELVQIINK